jgi:3-hydroxybutyryl-CoA dehydratase
MPTAKFEDFKVGDTASITKTISEADISRFAEITGDYNPLHMNEEYAKKTMFGKRVAHGILSAGLISAVLGMKLPGPGALYLDQTLTFKKPVFIGDILTATGKVKEKIVKQKEGKPPMNLLKISTVVTKKDGIVVTEGEATIMLL